LGNDTRRRWEEKHRREHSAGPRPTLEWVAAAANTHRRPHPIALDLACGQGRHSAELLNAGYDVIAADISANALGRLRSRCAGLGGSLLAAQTDLDTWPFAAGCFDLTVQIDYLERSLLDPIKRSTRPGGLVLVDTFLDDPAARTTGEPRAHGPSNPDYLLRPGELDDIFRDWTVIESGQWADPVPRAAVLARWDGPLTSGPRLDTRG